MKTFGRKIETIDYIRREGVYGLVIQDGQCGVVKVNNKYFLPGGGLDEGEDHLECLKREFKEEIAYSIGNISYLDTFKEYHQSGRSGSYYELIGHVYRLELTGPLDYESESDHELVWLDFQDLDKMQLGYAAYILKKALIDQDLMIESVTNRDKLALKVKYQEVSARFLAESEDDFQNNMAFFDDWHQDKLEGEKITSYGHFQRDLVGIVRLWQSPYLDKWLIEGLEVKDSFRRNGIGRRLLKSGLDLLKSMDIKTVYVNISKANSASIKLHEGLGFQLIEEGTLNSFGEYRGHMNHYRLDL